MLVQVLALLGLGVLGSSAPLRAPPARARTGSPRDERSRALVGLIIRELLQDMKKLNSNAVPSVVTVNATLERCIHSRLKTFASTLAALNTPSKIISRKLTRLSTYKDILPKDLDKECETAEVTWDDFLNTLERFLRLLSEKIQDTKVEQLQQT